MALRREIAQAEKQLAEADARLSVVTRQHFLVKQERLNTEENLAAANVRLKNLLGELQLARKEAKERANMVVQDKKMTMGELTRNVETTLKTILDEKFGDERFVAAITEQTAAAGASTDRVRVEFEGDEVFWSLQDNYTFENLLVDASRYWDLAHQDAFLVDERGAIWPNDGYVGLELQRTPNAKIALKIKPVATTVDDDVEVYGHDGDESEDFSEEDFDQGLLAIAVAAEDELLLAQAKGQATALTNKQKLAIRRKLKFEMYYFLIFVVVRTLGLCLLTTRRALASRPLHAPPWRFLLAHRSSRGRCMRAGRSRMLTSWGRPQRRHSPRRTLATTTRRRLRISPRPKRSSIGCRGRCRTASSPTRCTTASRSRPSGWAT